jgi:ferredoxin-NADP reductase
MTEVILTVNGVNISAFQVLISLLCLALLPFLFKKEKTTGDTDGGGDISMGLRREMAYSSSQSLSSMASTSANTAAADSRIIHPTQFKQFKVIKRKQESHNTVQITMAIPGNNELGLKIGRHVSVKADIAGNKVIRAYTPVSQIDQKGKFDILVKRYDDGKLSNYIWNLKEGDWLDVRGPVGRYQWEKNAYPVMGLIAAGSGITPCLQLIRSTLESPVAKGDTTKFILYYQNRTEEDILMRQVLELLAAKHLDRLKVVFFLSKTQGSRWNDGKAGHATMQAVPKGKVGFYGGYIDHTWISEMHYNVCPYVAICGPSGFNGTMKDLLCDHGHDADTSVFQF